MQAEGSQTAAANKWLPRHWLPTFYSGLPMPAVSFEGAERFKMEAGVLHPVRTALLPNCSLLDKQLLANLPTS